MRKNIILCGVGGQGIVLTSKLLAAAAMAKGIPVMSAEFTIGRHSKASTGEAFKVLAPKGYWKWVGYLGVLTGFLILGYYSVVAGWTLEYVFEAATGQFAGKSSSEFVSMFQQFSQNPIRPLIWLTVFMLLTHFVIVKGVQKGIERSSKVLMPLLFILVVVLAVCSVMLPGAEKGIEFLLTPDFSKITPDVFLGAMGQAFFSLSLGMGCLSTYASYFGKETRLGHTAMSVGLIDTFVAVLAGLIIFPAAFSVGIEPDAGPSLIFITLPNVFQQAFSGVPLLAYVCSILFYVLLALAALTSTISLHEVSTAFLHEKFHFTRSKAATIITVSSLLIGIVSSLALGDWSSYTIAGMNLFDALDFLTAKIMLPLGGMFAAIFVGWVIDRRIVRDEVTNYGTLKATFYPVYIFILKFIAPIGIALIFMNELGLLG